MLSRYILQMAERGERTAFIEQGLYRSRAFSYGRVIERARAFADWLHREQLAGSGASEPPRVIIWAKPGAHWAMAFYGCVLAGSVVVPVDHGFSSAFVRQVADRTGASLLIVDPERERHLEISDLRRFLAGEIEALAPAPNGFLAQPSSGRGQLVEIVYTSGTTAQPRGVMITHGNLLANLEPIEREIRRYAPVSLPFRPVRFLHLIPLSHLFGQVMGLFIPQLMRGVVIFPESQAPMELSRVIRDRRVSVMVSVPQQLEALGAWALARLGRPDEAEAESVRAISERWSIPKRWWKFRRLHRALGWKMWAFVVGGARLPPRLESRWNAFGYAVIQGYGLTETAPAITITHPFKIRHGAVGRPLSGVVTRIAPDGEILVRGPNVSPGYFGDPEATEAAFSGGWLRTGDLGRFDDQGDLIYLGRKKEVIVTAEGLNIFPEDVESALVSQPAIQDAAVVGRESRGTVEGRALVHAVVVAAPGAGRAEVEAAVERANRALEPHQRIRGFSLWPEKELPRTASTGKIQRTSVAAWVNSAGAAAPPSPARRGQPDWHDFLAELGVSRNRLRPGARLAEDLGLSSLDRVELITWAQAEGYVVEENTIAKATTVQDLEAVLGTPARAAAEAVLEGNATALQEAERQEGPQSKRARRGRPEPRWPLSWPARVFREIAQRLVGFPLLRYYVRLRREGLERLANVPQPALFVSNHQSFFDAPLILRAFPARLRRRISPAMSEDAFLRHSRFSLFLTRLIFNGYLISGNPARAQEALRHAGWLAERGCSTLLFPEGERTSNGRIEPFRPGVGVIAERLGLPVVAIRVQGLFEIWPRTKRRPVQGTARVTFGDTFNLHPGETVAAFTRRLEEYYRNWT